MLYRGVDVVVALLGVHVLLKFAVFFVLPYARRRAALDRAYGDKPTATRAADAVLLTLTITLSGLLFWRGTEPASFLGGLWIGATLIQLYFHRFHEELPPERTPPGVVSPIKLMSYAIQAAPARPWREMTVMGMVVVWTLVLFGRRYL